jgi:hypothetical protein
MNSGAASVVLCMNAPATAGPMRRLGLRPDRVGPLFRLGRDRVPTYLNGARACGEVNRESMVVAGLSHSA